MTKLRRLLCVFLSLTMLFTLIPASAKADSDTVQASGEINASAIHDKGSLTLTNDLTLKMDINRTLSHINCGKYTLTVKGDNTLSVINEGTAIEGYKIISNCNMVVRSTKTSGDDFAMNMTGGMEFRSESLIVEGQQGIKTYSSNLYIDSAEDGTNTTKITARNGAAISGRDMSLYSDDMTIKGTTYGIYCSGSYNNGQFINATGEIYITADNIGVSAKDTGAYFNCKQLKVISKQGVCAKYTDFNPGYYCFLCSEQAFDISSSFEMNDNNKIKVPTNGVISDGTIVNKKGNPATVVTFYGSSYWKETVPFVCNSFKEFKIAMESADTDAVMLGEVNELLPVIQGDGLLFAIDVYGVKHLNLAGNSVFTAPAGTSVKTYAGLLHTQLYDTLVINGSGSLTFRAVATSSYNSVIYNQGANVFVNGGSLIGSHNNSVYGKAIWQDSGGLYINSGRLLGDNYLPASDTPGKSSAVFINGGTSEIKGGYFKMDCLNQSYKGYGLEIGKDATVDLQGGTYEGILLPTDSTPLADYLDESFYTTLTNGNTFNPTSVYSQGYVESNKTVRVVWMIDQVTVTVDSPVVGKFIDETEVWVPSASGCRLSEGYPKWYKDGVLVTDGKFAEGAGYKAVVRLEAKDELGAAFASNVSASFNGKPASVTVPAGLDPSQCIELTYDFGKMPTVVNTVEFSITSPKEHSTPAQSISESNPAYRQAPSNINTFGAPLKWEYSTNGSTWQTMSSTSTFTEGYYYRVNVDIVTESGYEYALDPQSEPDVSAFVNGYSATVSRYSEKDPTQMICVQYDFGQLNDSVIEEIRISGVTVPVVGEKPNYNCSIMGSGYHTDTHYDSNMIINGMGWWDYTADNWLSPDEPFQIGHQYRLSINVETDEGYEFYTSGKYYEPQGWGYINNNFATFGVNSMAANNQKLSWVFDCQPVNIKSIAVSDLDEPMDGEHPDFSAIVDSDYCTVESITWYDENMDEMTDQATFVGGNRYRLLIEVVSKEINGSKYCKFIQNKTVATLNGIDVKKVTNDSWQEVESTTSFVRIYYTYVKAEMPPVTTYTISFDPNGGKGAMADVNVSSDYYALPACGFEAPDGKRFKGWSIFGVEKSVGEVINISQNISITALWEIIPHEHDYKNIKNDKEYHWYECDCGMKSVIEEHVYDDDTDTTCNVCGYVRSLKEKDAISYDVVVFKDKNSKGGVIGEAKENDAFVLPECKYAPPEDGMKFIAWAIGDINGERKQPGDIIVITGPLFLYAVWGFDMPTPTPTPSGNNGNDQKADSTANPSNNTSDSADSGKITLKGTKIKKLIAGKKTITVLWKKQTKDTTGYQIQYSTNKMFKKGSKTVTVKKNKTVKKTIKKLMSNKKFYVRVRTYKKYGKTKYYSAWSKVKSVKVL